MYPSEIVLPMKEELTDSGFKELLTATDVDSLLSKPGVALVVLNSVCGCAAGNARPGALLALSEATKKPDYIYTTFAGFDVAAVERFREKCKPYPPSSPAMAIFKNGQLVHFIERHHIEGSNAQMIASNLINAFNEYC